MYAWFDSFMLSYMHYSCKLGFKYYSFILDYMCLCVSVVDFTFLTHVKVFMWSMVWQSNGYCHA